MKASTRVVKHGRARAIGFVMACAFVACGRRELGSYGSEYFLTAGSGSAFEEGPVGGGGSQTTSGGGVFARPPPGPMLPRGGQGPVNPKGPAGNAGTAAGDGGRFGERGIEGGQLNGASTAGAGGGTGEGGEGSAGAPSGGTPDGGAAGSRGDVPNPSCKGLDGTCGVEGESCCEAHYLPKGTVHLGGSVESHTVAAVVSAFYLDKYEVSVGRFRTFLANYDAWLGNLIAGVGQHPRIEGTGWQEAWLERVPRNAEELKAEVDNCFSIPFSTMTSQTADPSLPMNCVSWYEAFAFCAWDGGRLPTEAEWEYAAAGGGENRLYPWGENSDTNGEHAVYDCIGPPSGTCIMPPVGSRPLGAARWGHLDMAGSVAEWGFDGAALYPDVCKDCANVSESLPRIARGGNFTDDEPTDMRVALRLGIDPSYRLHFVGFRCAR